jgi:hypothetical protein
MTVDELSKFIANIDWTHHFLSYDIDVPETNLESADITIPHVADNYLSICYNVEFECIPGDRGDYYTPPSPAETNVESFEVTDAYVIINKNNVKLNLNVVNEKGITLRDVLGDICSTYIDEDTLADMYDNGRYDYDDGYYDD